MKITTSGGDTVAGEQYTLTCTVTVPESSGLSGTPTVEWTGDDGQTGVTEGTPETSGRVTTLTLTFNPLQDSQDGVYTCRATFSCQGVTDQTVSGLAVLELDVIGECFELSMLLIKLKYVAVNMLCTYSLLQLLR